MSEGSGVVVARLRARRGEIEQAIFTRVRETVPDARGEADAEYVEGLRAAVAAAVEFGLAGLERGEDAPVSIPVAAVAQARRAARIGVSLDAVLRRYIVGHAVMWDYVMEEADRVEPAGRGSALREMSQAQSSLLDRLVIGVTREHVAELQRAGRSREHRLLERVRVLLADTGVDEDISTGELRLDVDYELTGEHLGVIATGIAAEQAVRQLAARTGRRLLSVPYGEQGAWAWFGGSERLSSAELRRITSSDAVAVEGVVLAFGEPASGPGGWRLTHRQALAAHLVARRRGQRLTRYADVVLLATACKDRALGGVLLDTYIAPLEDPRGGGPVLYETLREYIAAEYNVSSAAAALGVVRGTVVNRLQTIEERLGRTLHPCSAELQIALLLDELTPDP